jgi:hypothetical protein
MPIGIFFKKIGIFPYAEWYRHQKCKKFEAFPKLQFLEKLPLFKTGLLDSFS